MINNSNSRLKLAVRFLPIVALGLLLFGCAVYNDQKGVKNLWRDPDLPAFVKGVTTQSEVIERLGPPSQVIGVSGQTIFYYMLEKRTGRGLILLVFNMVNQKFSYDRAIFFFDGEGVLTDYALSQEKIDYEEP